MNDAINQARRALMSLRLEVAPPIADDLTALVEAAAKAAEANGYARALRAVDIALCDTYYEGMDAETRALKLERAVARVMALMGRRG